MLKIKLTFLFFFIYLLTFCQEGNKNLILTYSVKTDSHGITDYYWIIPNETIDKRDGYKIYPLYLDSFSTNSLGNCKEGKPVNIFTSHKDNNFDFNKEYTNNIEYLKKVLIENKTLIERVKKRWYKPSKRSEIVSIYITPVKGNFYYCNAGEKMEKEIKYQGKIALPDSNIKLDLQYLKTDKIQNFLFVNDFSIINYYNTL